MPMDRSNLYSVGRVLAALIGLTFLFVVVRRRGDELLEGGWAIYTMLLVSPLVWSFYLVWLMPTFCVCLAALGPFTRIGWRAQAAWALLVALYCIVAFPVSLTLRPFATLALQRWVGGEGAARLGQRR